MTKTRGLAKYFALSMMLMMGSTPAAAEPVKSILQFLEQANVIDQKIVDASELIHCLATHSPSECVDLQEAANDLASDTSSAAEKEAARFMPDDPMVKTAIDVVRAALQEDWLRVLELTGVQLLGQIACEAGVAFTGPLKPFICGEFADKVLAKAEPVVHEVLVVVRDFPNVDIWKLITLVGFELACDIAEDEGVPLAGEACGVLGAAVKAIADLSKAVLDALDDGAQAVVNIVTGSGNGSAELPPEWWYAHNVRPRMYERVSERLATGSTNFGMTNAELKECLDHYGIQVEYCVLFDARLKGEAETLYKFVLTMPDTYFDGWLKTQVRDRARYRYYSNDAAVYQNYIHKLPAEQWGDYVRGFNPILTQLPKEGISDYKIYYLPRIGECLSEVNKKFNVGNQLSWGIENWVCFQAVGKRFADAVVLEKKRIADSIFSKAKTLGCKPTTVGSSPELMFICQSYAALGACFNLANKEYKDRRLCTLDGPQASMRLGIHLVSTLTAERCVYQDKDKSGAPRNPRVLCSRPWKRDTCEALLQSYRVRWGLQDTSIHMICDYQPPGQFRAEQSRAEQILTALNGAPAANLSPRVAGRSLQGSFDSDRCRTLWDPLAINCPHQTKMPALSGELATPAIESCPPDPDKNGADQVCYQTVFTASDSNREIFENQTLSPANKPPNACRKTVSYYVPEAPVLVTNGPVLQVKDQFQIQCTFKKVTRDIEWPQCDNTASTAMRILKGAEEAGGRYSGIVSIDGGTVGVTSSPEGGGGFQSVKLWKFDSPGQHEISCQTDNAFRFAIEGEETYLKAAISVDVGTRLDGRTYRNFEPNTAATLPVRQIPSEAMPRLRGLVVESERSGKLDTETVRGQESALPNATQRQSVRPATTATAKLECSVRVRRKWNPENGPLWTDYRVTVRNQHAVPAHPGHMAIKLYSTSADVPESILGSFFPSLDSDLQSGQSIEINETFRIKSQVREASACSAYLYYPIAP